MAESFKRRLAAARLAVAFVAAGTIAGATAWAQGSPPGPTAKSSAYDAFLKIKSENVVDGSLLYKDFHKGQVPSERLFIKMENSLRMFQKAVFDRYYPKVEIDRYFIKGQSSDYLKIAEADARYIKLTDSLVRGNGSVFTATKLVSGQEPVRLLAVPSMFTVDTTGPTIRITNTGDAPLTYSACGTGAGTPPSGTLQPNEHVDCDDGNAAQTVQLIGGGANPSVATLNFSAVAVPGGKQSTVQILIGL